MDKKALVDYVKQFEGPEECYKHSCKVTIEALEQIEANVKCIQNIFQDPNYLPALLMMGIYASIKVTGDGTPIIRAEFGVSEDENISASTESAG